MSPGPTNIEIVKQKSASTLPKRFEVRRSSSKSRVKQLRKKSSTHLRSVPQLGQTRPTGIKPFSIIHEPKLSTIMPKSRSKSKKRSSQSGARSKKDLSKSQSVIPVRSNGRNYSNVPTQGRKHTPPVRDRSANIHSMSQLEQTIPKFQEARQEPLRSTPEL